MRCPQTATGRWKQAATTTTRSRSSWRDCLEKWRCSSAVTAGKPRTEERAHERCPLGGGGGQAATGDREGGSAHAASESAARPPHAPWPHPWLLGAADRANEGRRTRGVRSVSRKNQEVGPRAASDHDGQLSGNSYERWWAD